MTQTSNKLLKVTGILMIIGGGLGIIVGIIAVLGVGMLALTLGEEANLGLLTISAILALVSSVISLIAGIFGVSGASKPEKAQRCIVFGVLAIALAVLGNILNMAGGNSFSPTSLLTGLILPVLYLIGAFQNKKLMA
jgi:hypothetical protein